MVKISVPVWLRSRTPSPLWSQLYQEITIKDETNEFDDKEFKQEYKKIYRDAEECATILTKALNELPVYYRYHIQKKIVLGKGLNIVRYKTFIKKHNQALNQSLKRKEKKTQRDCWVCRECWGCWVRESIQWFYEYIY